MAESDGNAMDFGGVGRAVERRMRALGLTNTALAKRANVDRGLVAKILSGQPWSMRGATLGRIETALSWPAGAIEDIGRGRMDITPGEAVDGASRLDAIDGRLDRIEELLEQILDDSRATQ